MESYFTVWHQASGAKVEVDIDDTTNYIEVVIALGKGIVELADQLPERELADILIDTYVHYSKSNAAVDVYTICQAVEYASYRRD